MRVAQRRADLEQRHAVEIEHGLGLRMVAVAHTVAGEAQHVADAHRGAAEDVALDRDAVAVAAGDLHHGRVADAGQERADGEARHVAIGAAAVGGVDRVDVAVEHAGAAVDVFGIGGIRRVELGRHGEGAGAQHALEAAGRRVARQDRQRIAGHRLVFEDHCVPPAGGRADFSRATASHDERPASLRSTANCTHARRRCRRASGRCRRSPRPRRIASAGPLRTGHRRARRRKVRCAAPWDSSSDRTCRSSSARTARTSGSRTEIPLRRVPRPPRAVRRARSPPAATTDPAQPWRARTA